LKYTIKRTVVDEGVAKCLMSLVCWKSLDSLILSQYLTMLISFDNHSFCPQGILPSFLVQLGGKTLDVDVKVVDAPLDHKFLLGFNWTYVMTTILSFVFRTLCSPHDGKIMTIDHLSSVYASPNASVGSSIPMVENFQLETKNIGVKMYSSLMGIFKFMALVHHIYAMSSKIALSKRSIPLCTSYFNNPWTLPSSKMYFEGQSHTIISMPLSATKIEYQVVLDSSTDPNPITSQTDKEDPVLEPLWATSLSCSHDFFYGNLPLDEDIFESMNGSNKPWDDMLQPSYFIPNFARIEQYEFRSTLSEIVGHIVVPLDTHGIYAQGNMESISPTVMINISRIPSKIENVYIGADCSPEEILIYIELFKEFQDVFAW
jgi:hypothetical protein